MMSFHHFPRNYFRTILEYSRIWCDEMRCDVCLSCSELWLLRVKVCLFFYLHYCCCCFVIKRFLSSMQLMKWVDSVSGVQILFLFKFWMQLKVSGMLWERLYVPGMRIIKFNIAFCTILISFQCFHNIRCMKEGIIWLSTVYGGRTISTLSL